MHGKFFSLILPVKLYVHFFISFILTNLFPSILVLLSILFAKQHLVLDIFSGIAVAELGIFVSSKFFRGDTDRETEKIIT